MVATPIKANMEGISNQAVKESLKQVALWLDAEKLKLDITRAEDYKKFMYFQAKASAIKAVLGFIATGSPDKLASGLDLDSASPQVIKLMAEMKSKLNISQSDAEVLEKW